MPDCRSDIRGLGGDGRGNWDNDGDICDSSFGSISSIGGGDGKVAGGGAGGVEAPLVTVPPVAVKTTDPPPATVAVNVVEVLEKRKAVAGVMDTVPATGVLAISQTPRPQVETRMLELSGATQISVTRPWGRPVPKTLQLVPPLVVR